jgi:anti-anti-sigma regulatory factor
MTEMDLQFTRETTQGRTIITLSGVINERTDLQQLFENIEGETLTINLKNVTRINSCGVRDWVNAVKSITQPVTIEYTECSRAVVDQLIMVFNFLTGGSILSFQAPYYCDACDEEFNMLINVNEHFPDEDSLEEPEAPDFDCPKCGKTMAFNEDEDKYFLFLSE